MMDSKTKTNHRCPGYIPPEAHNIRIRRRRFRNDEYELPT